MREFKLENAVLKPALQDMKAKKSRRPRDADLSVGTRLLIKGMVN
jgi:hypothetical protein